MAVDDVTTVITVNMAQEDTTDRQPASGVEEMVLHVADVDFTGTAPNEIPHIDVDFIDGTNNQAQMVQSGAAASNGSYFAMKMMADNTNYFRFTHRGTTTGDYGFSVIAVG